MKLRIITLNNSLSPVFMKDPFEQAVFTGAVPAGQKEVVIDWVSLGAIITVCVNQECTVRIDGEGDVWLYPLCQSDCTWENCGVTA